MSPTGIPWHHCQRAPRRHRVLCAIVWLGLLAGCATDRTAYEPALGVAATAPATFIDRFSLSGRLSIRVGDRLDSVRMEWTRVPGGDTIRFFSPFGSQLALVTASAAGARLQRGEVVERAGSISELTLALLGVGLDTKMLARWVQGFDLGAADQLSNGGIEPADRWTIQAESLKAVDGFAGGRIAGRILATAGDTSLRMVIDAFSPLPDDGVPRRPPT